jgi:hypothetical protein
MLRYVTCSTQQGLGTSLARRLSLTSVTAELLTCFAQVFALVVCFTRPAQQMPTALLGAVTQQVRLEAS